MKTFKFSPVLRTRENTDVFITLDDNIYGIHHKRVNILYMYQQAIFCWINILTGMSPGSKENIHTKTRKHLKYLFFSFLAKRTSFGKSGPISDS